MLLFDFLLKTLLQFLSEIVIKFSNKEYPEKYFITKTKKYPAMQDAKFFHPLGVFAEVRPSKPIGVLFLSSLRDIFFEDCNGRTIDVLGKKVYLEGVLERTIRETKPGGLLHGLVDVKGVVFDDTPEDLAKAKKNVKGGEPGNVGTFTKTTDRIATYCKTEKLQIPAICPLSLLSPEKVFLIPSTFRKIGKENLVGRKKAKHAFEHAVLITALSVRADIIVSDSYMAIIDPLVHELGMYGRVLNIHPGPSMDGQEFCFRGKDPVGDAIRFAQQNAGTAKTGATLHFVNGKIDEGNAIAFFCETPVYSDDTEIGLMVRNYKVAKLPLFVAGLRHYVLNIFPNLQHIHI